MHGQRPRRRAACCAQSDTRRLVTISACRARSPGGPRIAVQACIERGAAVTEYAQRMAARLQYTREFTSAPSVRQSSSGAQKSEHRCNRHEGEKETKEEARRGGSGCFSPAPHRGIAIVCKAYASACQRGERTGGAALRLDTAPGLGDAPGAGSRSVGPSRAAWQPTRARLAESFWRGHCVPLGRLTPGSIVSCGSPSDIPTIHRCGGAC
jgi:hypothetical protein